jgi:hypothetical protein
MKPQDIKEKPGAQVGATGSLSLVIVWVAGNLFHWAVSAEDGVVMATVISAVALFVANNGLARIPSLVWWGRNRDHAPDAAGAQVETTT